ncbi:sulfite exporter TauE/SafE family protein [Brevibacillus ginsengisoli]|uniref:sulfite exporter TauE/SafE family protein n=1 Tax=Brevibacillus ginsengisoli TaxID=363854 RepID=UPI003CE99782
MMIGLPILFLLIGCIAGIIGSLVGIGGGMFFVPALLFFANQHEAGSMSPSMATGTSLLVIVITALSSTLAFLKQKKVDTETAWLFFWGSAPGSIAGVYLNKVLHPQSFYLLFGLFQICMFMLMMVKDKLKPRTISWDVHRTYTDPEGVTHEYGYKRWVAIVVAFFVGVTSSLFGVGGGVLLVPAMIVLFRFPPHLATATSMFVIFLSAIVGSTTNLLNHQIHWLYALMLAPGAWIGGKYGAILAQRIKGKTLVLLLRLLILGIAIQMIAKAFMT